MASRSNALLVGLAAVLVGALQVGTTLTAAAKTHLTIIATLRLSFCGSLLVVGALVLVSSGRDQGKDE
jgi:hypothetical protein